VIAKHREENEIYPLTTIKVGKCAKERSRNKDTLQTKCKNTKCKKHQKRICVTTF
jgi:hypothetical protein